MAAQKYGLALLIVLSVLTLTAIGLLAHRTEQQSQRLEELRRQLVEARAEGNRAATSAEALARRVSTLEGRAPTEVPRAVSPPAAVVDRPTREAHDAATEPAADPNLVPPVDWVASVTAEGFPFLSVDEIPEAQRAGFESTEPRLYFRSENGEWIGEFELSDPDMKSLALKPEQVPIARDLALAHYDLQNLRGRLIDHAIRTSTEAYDTRDEANAAIARKREAQPNGPGWFVHLRGSQFIVCEQMGHAPEYDELRARIEELADLLRGESEVGASGVVWLPAQP